jgi:CheY-like chemotaxis protein
MHPFAGSRGAFGSNQEAAPIVREVGTALRKRRLPRKAQFNIDYHMAMRAIIIEDEILAAIHLEDALGALGIETIGIAPDRKSALELAKSGPDLALIDLNLRDGFTGPTIAGDLAAMGVSVLFVTANPNQLGALAEKAPVLEKPLEQERLASVLQLMGAPVQGPDSTLH